MSGHLRPQIELMRRHRDTLRGLLDRDRDHKLTLQQIEALEHAVQAYTEGANMLEESLVFYRGL